MRTLVAALTLLAVCDAYRVLLFFPFPSRSHANLGGGYLRNLLAAGHEVTYVTPVLNKNTHKNLQQIDVSSNFGLFPSGEVLDLQKLINKELPAFDSKVVMEMLFGITNGTLRHEQVQRLINDPNEKFDVVILQWMFGEAYSGLASVFGCPYIWASSMEPHALVLSLIGEDPNPAYVASYSSTSTPPFDFYQRAEGLWNFLTNKYYKWLQSRKEAALFEEVFSSAAAARGRQLPSYYEAKYNASMMLGNSHVAAGYAVSLPQSYVPIAGYHVEETVKPLAENFQSIMDNAKHGVIYFSMGTIVKSKSMPTELKRGLLDMFGKLKQTVIWKLEEPQENVPKNVHLVEFAPQPGILNHSNCLLFITHGGLLSNIEALHFGVPIIGMPVFVDQFLNIDRAVQKGYAKRVDLDLDTPNTLREAIDDILGNPRYRQRIKELSFVYHHRPVSPGKELLHWVDHVVQTRGAPHLRSPALVVPWYQQMYLDLLGLVLVVILLSFLVLKRVSINKIDVNKKNL